MTDRGGSEKPKRKANADINHVAALSEIYKELAKLSIVTLDTHPRSKVMSLPVGSFVSLDDIREVFRKHLNKVDSSLAVR